MQIIVKGKTLNVGWKTYIAWCSNIYCDGILDRFETNKRLTSIKLDNQFIGVFLTKYLTTEQAQTLYEVLNQKSYQFVFELIDNPISLGMVCLYISRSNAMPTKHALFRRYKMKWLYKLLEESIQYPVKDKLCTNYLSTIDGNLKHYISLAKFCPTPIINNYDVIEEFGLSIDELNSIDECGWLIRIDDDNFKWSTNRIKDLLCNYNYRDLLWSQYNKVIRNINKERFS